LNIQCRLLNPPCNLPVILFPGNAAGLAENADAVFSMSLLNSRDVQLHYHKPRQFGAPIVYKHGIEPISMAYIVESNPVGLPDG